MKWLVTVIADVNDADYMTEETVVDEKNLHIVHKMVEELGTGAHNWEKLQELGSEEIEWYREFIPRAHYGGDCHTVETVKIRPYTKPTVLL
jgi:hypothetical protein